jgi:quercetin dioxygenase-like cupin family protein
MKATNFFCLTAAFVLLTAPLQAREWDTAAKPPVVVTPVMKTTATTGGGPIVLPQKDAQVVVSTYDIAPGAVLPVHKHPFPRYAYVLAGTLKVTNTETGKSTVFKTGDFVIEDLGQWHKGESVGGDPVKLLVIDQVEKDKNNVVLKGHDDH